jgi:antitoxin CcdA
MRMKRPTNLTIDAELLDEAKALGVNLSSVLEQGLRERVAKARRERWLEENADAIAEHNERVAGRGVFSDRLRRF